MRSVSFHDLLLKTIRNEYICTMMCCTSIYECYYVMKNMVDPRSCFKFVAFAYTLPFIDTESSTHSPLDKYKAPRTASVPSIPDRHIGPSGQQSRTQI